MFAPNISIQTYIFHSNFTFGIEVSESIYKLKEKKELEKC